jgi:hypothetical protein
MLWDLLQIGKPLALPPNLQRILAVSSFFRPRGAEIAASSNVNGRWRLRVMTPGS